MKIKARVIQKVISIFLTFLLLVNSFTPYLLIVPTFSHVKAQDISVSTTSEPTPTDAVDSIPTPNSIPEPTLIPTETASPTPIVEVAPTSEPTITPTPIQTPSQWTFEKVELNKEYVSPQNSEVKLAFTKLPDPVGNIKIEEIILTEDQIKQTGSLSNKAYDITSDMKDGDFSYNLSLPIPESSKGKTVEVKFAEDISNIGSAEKAENTLTKTDTSVSVASLDHMTIFVVVNPTPSGDLCVSAGATNGTGCYSTIQAAIGAANNGDDITVKNGTYILSSTLQVNKEVAIIGESQVDTIINTTGVGSGYGVGITASNVTLKNFTINPNGASGGGYPIHVSNTPNLVSNLTLENITIDGSYRTAFDIHGVIGGSLKNLTAKNSSHGNGLSLTGSDTITVESYTSSGNAWGGIALYNSKYTSPQRATHDITLKGNTFSINESIEIYEENEYGLTIAGITAEGYDFKVTNDTYRGPGSENFVHYKKNITDASSYALELQTNPSVIANTASIIKQISTGDYYVVNGLKIQEAIAAASSGDTINVEAGNYTEVGQIVINKNLSIVGADKTTTIIKPAQNTGVGNHLDANSWILVNSGVTFNLSKVTLDGIGKLINHGILSHGHGTIDDNIFTNITYNQSGPDYKGIGIELYGSDMTVSNNSFSNIGRIGVFTGFGSIVTITGNTYTGKGTGNFLDYGFEIGRNGQATMSNNTISNNKGLASDGSTSAGILVTSYYNPGTPSGATITSNTISNCTDGIAVGYNGSDASVVVAHNNNLSGNIDTGITSTNPTVNATKNWWGDQSGPSSQGTGVGDNVSTNVTFSPWCLTSDCSTYSSIYSNSTGVNLGTSQDVTVGDITLEDVTGTGSLFVAKYDGIPSTGGLSTGVDGFYYDIQASGIDFPVSITLDYSDSLSDSNYLDENHFTSLFYYKDGSWHDYKLDTVGTTGYAPSTVAIDKPNNKITATLQHLTPIVPVIDTTAPPVPTLVSPADGASVKPAGLILNWSDSVDPEGSNPVKYYYKSSYTSTVGANNALTSPIYTSGILPTSQINASGSSDNIYYWQARACDSLNNCSDWSGPWEVTIDRTNPTGPGTPVATVTSPTNQTTITWNWTDATDALSGIKDYLWNLWQGAVKKESGTTTDTFKTLDLLSYGDGIFTFDVQSEDKAGNVSSVMTSAAITVDTISPNVPTLNSPIDGFVTKGIAFSQTWNSVAGVVLYEYQSCNVDPGDIGGTCSSVKHTSPYTGTTKSVGAGQPDSHFWWRVRAKDAAGNWSSWSIAREIIIDNTVPTKPTITSPTAEQYFKTTPILNQWGAITDASGIKQYTVEYIYDDGHSFSGAPYRYTTTNSRNHSPSTTEQGGVTIRVRAEDNAGNIGEWSNPIHYVYDATAPTVTSVSSDGATYNLASVNPTIQVTFNENISNTPSIEIFSPVGTPQSVNNCGDTDEKTFCFDYNLLSEETTHTIKIFGGQDVAGNTMAVNNSHTFKVDRIVPTITTVDTTTADGSYTIGQVIDFNLTFNEIINVSGTPEFSVSAGPGRKAIYDSGSGTNTLTFKYTVGSSDGTPSYLFANDGSINLSGGSIKDTNENDANLTLPSKDIFLADHSIFIDTNVPVITANGNITVEADSVSGATVNYTAPIVTDNHDSDFSSVCGPLSGTVFAFGTTTVTCNASDAAGNNASPTSFTVTVVDTTAPASPVVTSSSHILETWSSDRTIDVSWSASDFSGITGYSYQWSISPTTNPNNTLEVTGTSNTSGSRSTSQSIYFHIKALDGAGNWSSVTHSGPFWVDANNPTGSWVTPLDGSYLRSTVNLEVSPNDIGSGVKHVVFRIKRTGGSFTTISTVTTNPYQGSFDTTTKTDGTYVLRAQIVDDVNRLINIDINVTIDNTTPVLSTQSPFSGWYNTEQTSTFDYTDTNGVVSGTPVTCVINTEGLAQTCSVTPSVCDAAGNCNTTTVTSNGADIDFTNPSSVITTPSNSGSGSTKYMSSWSGSIEGTATDDLSDINSVKVSIQKGSTQYFNGSTFIDSGTEILLDATYVAGNWNYAGLTSPDEGSYTIKSHAIDNATNMESTYTLTIILDKTIPEVAISLNPAVADASNGWYKTQPEITLTAIDTNKDIIEYQWNSETGSWTTYSSPFKPGSEGEYILYYRARDKASNYSGVGIKNIKWDQTELTDGPLNVSVSPNPTSGTTSVVKWEEAKDNVGIDRYEIKWSLKNGDKSYTESVGSNIREKTISNLIEGDWTIEVKAFDWSGKSKSASTDLTVDRTGPSTPTLSIFGTAVGSVSLSWTKIDGANDYIIWYGTNPGSYQYGAKVGDTQGYTVQGLGAGSYYFIVKAIDSSGNQSGNSNEVSSGTIVGAPGVGENTPAQGFAAEVLGEATESAKLTPTGTVLGTDTKNAKKKMLLWQWVLISLFAFGGIYFGYKKWKK